MNTLARNDLQIRPKKTTILVLVLVLHKKLMLQNIQKVYFYTSSACTKELGILQFKMPSPFNKEDNEGFNFFEIHSHLVYFAYIRGYMSFISYWQPPKLAFRLVLILEI